MKKISITDPLKQAITASVGDQIDFEKVSIYEATATTTAPLVKAGSIYDGARFTAATMEQAASMINSGEFVPMHISHDQKWDGMPVGRVFQAKASPLPDGNTELRTLFYLDSTAQDMADKIDQGSVQEVSIGMLPKKATCSGCGFDYMDPNNEEAWWDRTCANGHVLGMGGYHLVLDGVGKLMELSLVSKGAATGSSIKSARQRLLASQFEALRASCHNVEHKTVFTPPVSDAEDDMTLQELKAKLSEAEAKVIAADAKVTEAEAKVIAADAKVTEAEAKVVAAEAKVTEAEAKVVAAEAKVTEAEAKVVAAEARATEAEAKVVTATAGAKGNPFRLPLDGIVNASAAQDAPKKPTPAGTAAAYKTTH